MTAVRVGAKCLAGAAAVAGLYVATTRKKDNTPAQHTSVAISADAEYNVHEIAVMRDVCPSLVDEASTLLRQYYETAALADANPEVASAYRVHSAACRAVDSIRILRAFLKEIKREDMVPRLDEPAAEMQDAINNAVYNAHIDLHGINVVF